jgi:sulfur-carrier protein
MPRVFIPPAARAFAENQQDVQVPGRSVREVVEQLEQRFPGIKACLCEGESLAPGMSVVVDNSISALGLLQAVEESSEIHFLPAFGGG